MPTTYGYCRVSTQRQADSGLSLDAQKDLIERDFQYKPEGREWGGFYIDPGQSASIPLTAREAGCRLDLRLQIGDCVVITRLDRGFRNCQDFFNTMARWLERGVKCKMLDLGLDTSTPAGEMMAGMMAVFAQYERRLISARVKEINARRKALGLACNQRRIGHKTAGPKGKRHFVPDPWNMAWIEKIYEQHEAGYSSYQISKWLLIQKIKLSDGSRWLPARIRTAIKWWQAKLQRDKRNGPEPPPPRE